MTLDECNGDVTTAIQQRLPSANTCGSKSVSGYALHNPCVTLPLEIQEAERIVLPGWIDKLHRFASFVPGSPMAHYYYALALSKQTPGSMDNSVVESELKKAIDLDPKVGKAYLQLGILIAEK